MEFFVLTIFFVLFFSIPIIWALARGVIKSRIRFICLLLCAVAAILTVVLFRNSLGKFEALTTPILERMFPDRDVSELAAFLTEYPGATQAAVGIAYSLTAPLMILLLFTALRFLTWIIYLIVIIATNKSIKEREVDIKLRPLRTIAYGVVSALVILFIVLTPVYSLARIAGPVVTSLNDAGVIPDDSTAKVVTAKIQDYSESPVLSLYGAVGGRKLNTAITTFEMEGTKTTLAGETEAISDMISDLVKISEGGDPEKWKDDQAAAVKSLAGSLSDSKIISVLICDAVGGITDKWLEGDDLLGIKKPDVGEKFEPVFNKLVENLNRDASETERMSADLKSVGDVASILIRDKVLEKLKDSDGVSDIISKGTTITDILKVIKANESLADLADFFTDIGLKSLGDQLKLPTVSDEEFESFFAEVTDSLNDILAGIDFNSKESIREAVRKLTVKFQAQLSALNIDVNMSDEMIDTYSEMILNQFRDKDGKVNVEDLKALFGVYLTE